MPTETISKKSATPSVGDEAIRQAEIDMACFGMCMINISDSGQVARIPPHEWDANAMRVE